MAPVATEQVPVENGVEKLKAAAAQRQTSAEDAFFNPFYSPAIADDGNDSYPYAKYKVDILPVIVTHNAKY
jgi:sulfonate dioxygenase